MKPMAMPSAKADASAAIGRSAISRSTYSSSALKVSPSSFLDLLGQRLGAALRGIEHVIGRRVQKTRHLALERLQLVTQFA
jgi:hypothetical protein